MTDIAPNAPRWAAAAWGAVAAAVGLGAAEIVAAVVAPRAAPVLAVGDATIAIAPEPLKHWAIETFGTADKPVLVGGVLIVLAAIAASAGVAAARSRPLGAVVALTLAAVGVAAAVTRPDASGLAALPAAIAGVVAAFLLWTWPRPGNGPGDGFDAPPRFDRRRFLWRSGTILAGTAIGGGMARLVGEEAAVEEARDTVTLPAPADPAPSTGTAFDDPGLSPWRTPTQHFYRIDTALSAPRVNPDTYVLRVFGRVDRELRLTYRDLLDRPLLERDITLCCVSNQVGGDLVGNARWLGVSLAPLLAEAGIEDGADQLVARSVDGWTAGAPTRLCVDGRDAMLAVGMNGEPLPIQHGFPVRMIVPGLYGYVSATKWLTELELTSFSDFDAYWIRRGWDGPGPIETASRIDTPRGRLDAGSVVVAGVAWAQHRGIGAVEVRVDDGPWHEAELSDAPSTDTWRQWRWEWDATPGRHDLTVRAIDGDGVPQTEENRPVLPGAATGLHTVTVTIE